MRKLIAAIAAVVALASSSAWAQSPFLGKWHGGWIGARSSTLEVQAVDNAGNAHCIYIYAENDPWNVDGKVSGNILSLADKDSGLTFQFELQADGTLDGRRYRHNKPAGRVTMSRD